MLHDLLNFSAETLVDDARLAFWMPVTNEEAGQNGDGTACEFEIPKHSAMQLLTVSVQTFNNWSRRLLVYRRIPDEEVSSVDPLVEGDSKAQDGSGNDSDGISSRGGVTADDLNPFRKKYFQGFTRSGSERS
ncbi:MAG: hypothetical protein M1823_001741 [Watsoniomyces obsoletus]|nr:MAG: hypothetical protein M1823_001741 [Watsoniomyces obsoletus]